MGAEIGARRIRQAPDALRRLLEQRQAGILVEGNVSVQNLPRGRGAQRALERKSEVPEQRFAQAVAVGALGLRGELVALIEAKAAEPARALGREVAQAIERREQARRSE